jgi:hypothetical protein
VGGVDLDHLESGHYGSTSRCLESGDNLINTGLVERRRGWITVIEWYRTGTEDGPPTYLRRLQARSSFPGRLTTGLPSGMGQLNAGNRSLRMNKSRYARKRLDMLISPDPHIPRRNPAVRGDGRGLDHHQRRPADGTASKVDQMPIACESFNRDILAHRRHRDSVSKRNSPDRQRAEQVDLRDFPVVIRTGWTSVSRDMTGLLL